MKEQDETKRIHWRENEREWIDDKNANEDGMKGNKNCRKMEKWFVDRTTT